MALGTVKFFNTTKGYGFIQPQGGGAMGKDVFVHISPVERAGLTTLNEGQHVEYELEESRGKTSAVNLGAAGKAFPGGPPTKRSAVTLGEESSVAAQKGISSSKLPAAREGPMRFRDVGLGGGVE
jgi:CspA family cold shock protein